MRLVKASGGVSHCPRAGTPPYQSHRPHTQPPKSPVLTLHSLMKFLPSISTARCFGGKGGCVAQCSVNGRSVCVCVLTDRQATQAYRQCMECLLRLVMLRSCSGPAHQQYGHAYCCCAHAQHVSTQQPSSSTETATAILGLPVRSQRKQRSRRQP